MALTEDQLDRWEETANIVVRPEIEIRLLVLIAEVRRLRKALEE